MTSKIIVTVGGDNGDGMVDVETATIPSGVTVEVRDYDAESYVCASCDDSRNDGCAASCRADCACAHDGTVGPAISEYEGTGSATALYVVVESGWSAVVAPLGAAWNAGDAAEIAGRRVADHLDLDEITDPDELRETIEGGLDLTYEEDQDSGEWLPRYDDGEGSFVVSTLRVVPAPTPSGSMASPPLAALAPRMLALLRELEWSATVDVSTGGYQEGCPICDNGREDEGDYPGGHVSDCRLRAVLDTAGAAPPVGAPSRTSAGEPQSLASRIALGLAVAAAALNGAIPTPVERARAAVTLLRVARDLLADHPRAQGRVRLALTSAGGAVRAAEGRVFRAREEASE